MSFFKKDKPVGENASISGKTTSYGSLPASGNPNSPSSSISPPVSAKSEKGTSFMGKVKGYESK